MVDFLKKNGAQGDFLIPESAGLVGKTVSKL